MLNIRLGRGYDQLYRNLIQNDSELKDRIIALINLFEKNPNDTRLSKHALTKKMKGKWAFSITTVLFLSIGPHKQVYKKQSPKR